MKRVSIFLITLALIAGTVGCGPTPPVEYSLTTAVAPSGSGTATDLTNASPYEEGTDVSIKAVANSGYRFIDWTAPAGAFVDADAAQTTFTMPGQNVTVTANFEVIHTLTVSSTVGGSVAIPGVGDFMYSEGAVVDLVAEADQCYRFANWADDVSTIGNTTSAITTITMNGDYSITANFEEEAVAFPDPNLEAAIREAIGKPTGPIYCSDLEELINLPAGERSISDLTGLQYCTNLSWLHLYDNQISDISPLADLTNLTELRLWGNEITDIASLAALTNLTTLYLSSNQISDVSPVASLTNLTTLYLSSNQISDVSPLASLTNLTTLRLSQNQISDVSPVASLTNLTSLYLDNNEISDISSLTSLTNLITLWLWANPINDISPLASLITLENLHLDHIETSDISPLAGLVNLDWLYIGYNQITDISPLVSLTKLQVLFLDGNLIIDISTLASLTNLMALNLQANQVTDISSLASLTGLGTLVLSHNQISDITPLAGLVNLSWLFLSVNEISDIYPLVQNAGLGSGDIVDLESNPLNSDSIYIYIPELEARGVTVYY